jgi:hypothetical protein
MHVSSCWNWRINGLGVSNRHTALGWLGLFYQRNKQRIRVRLCPKRRCRPEVSRLCINRLFCSDCCCRHGLRNGGIPSKFERMSATTVFLIGAIVCVGGCGISVAAAYRTMRNLTESLDPTTKSRAKNRTIVPPGNVVFRYPEDTAGEPWGGYAHRYVIRVSPKRVIMAPGNRIAALMNMPMHSR